MAALLGVVRTKKSFYNKSEDLRDRSFTHLKDAVDNQYSWPACILAGHCQERDMPAIITERGIPKEKIKTIQRMRRFSNLRAGNTRPVLFSLKITSTPYTKHFKRYTDYFKPYTGHSKRYTDYFKPYTGHLKRYTNYFKPYTGHLKRYSYYFKPYSAHLKHYTNCYLFSFYPQYHRVSLNPLSLITPINPASPIIIPVIHDNSIISLNILSGRKT